MVEMKDVPTEVWDSVYEKWQEALHTGWNSSLWRGCDLCRWINENHYNWDCEDCPLVADHWCDEGIAMDSMLHIAYYHDNAVHKWKSAVRVFLDVVRPYCDVHMEEDS